MLARAADWVKPGGRLVYATCSLEPAEGEAQVDALPRRAHRDFAIDPVGADELPAGIAAAASGWVRIAARHARRRRAAATASSSPGFERD